jgi:glyoxylase-like metal-dependent hydrolase (beta-lactamase superfamily II)
MNIPGIHELAIANTKVFVVEAQKNVLIDTGSAPLHEEVLKFLEKTGFVFENPGQKQLMKQGAYSTNMSFLRESNIKIDAIICTHYHSDHTGNLKRLKNSLKVPVAMHELDIPVVEGREEMPPPSFIPAEILKHLKIEPCGIDRALKDGEDFCDDLQIIHVPGHTWGSICLLYKNQALITGDCVVGYNERFPSQGNSELNPPVKMYGMDYAQAIKSLSTLLQYDFTAILPSHGTSIGERGKEKLRAMLGELGVI